MTPEAENAIRSVARKCRAEIIKAIDGRPKSDHDSIITNLLNKHARTIQCLPPGTFPAKRWLSYFVREIDKEMTR
ncbi:hypothetical protein ACP3UV_22330 [Mixta calida]|uniref:hypothetical protein n=1 Tax=Mixta calida TaxID=665913 RepID=UPI002906F253|nr:hypothetical protein [Mixta calida]MDU4288383.1 hypothetical protein [Mixta calida]